jgi:hypothetical protein
VHQEAPRAFRRLLVDRAKRQARGAKTSSAKGNTCGAAKTSNRQNVMKKRRRKLSCSSALKNPNDLTECAASI